VRDTKKRGIVLESVHKLHKHQHIGAYGCEDVEQSEFQQVKSFIWKRYVTAKKMPCSPSVLSNLSPICNLRYSSLARECARDGSTPCFARPSAKK
jgi:hypothetical protein